MHVLRKSGHSRIKCFVMSRCTLPPARHRVARTTANGRRSLIARPGLQFDTAVSIALAEALDVLCPNRPRPNATSRARRAKASRASPTLSHDRKYRFRRRPSDSPQTERLESSSRTKHSSRVAKDKTRAHRGFAPPGRGARGVGTKFSVSTTGSAPKRQTNCRGASKDDLLKASDDSSTASSGQSPSRLLASIVPVVPRPTPHFSEPSVDER
jgi:hypothetical protein